jgi:hypothetical protein
VLDDSVFELIDETADYMNWSTDDVESKMTVDQIFLKLYFVRRRKDKQNKRLGQWTAAAITQSLSGE